MPLLACRVFTEEELYDALVAHLHSLERDRMLHLLNQERYSNIARGLQKADFTAWKMHQSGCAFCRQQGQQSPVTMVTTHRDWIVHLLAETTERLREVEGTIEHLLPQIANQALFDAAVERFRLAQKQHGQHWVEQLMAAAQQWFPDLRPRQVPLGERPVQHVTVPLPSNGTHPVSDTEGV